MSIWGTIIAALGWKKEYLQTLDPVELYYIYFWVKKRETDFTNSLGEMLGTHWSADALRSLAFGSKDSGKPSDDAFIPLAIAINPELIKTLKEMGKKARSAKAPPWAQDLKKEEALARSRGPQLKTLADYEPSKLTAYAERAMKSVKNFQGM